MPHGAALAALLLASLLLTPTRAPAASGVSLVRLPSGLWSVAVRAEGAARPWRFLVDTGSTHTLLSGEAARTAGLVVRPGRHVRTPAGLVAAGETTIEGLRIGERRLPTLHALVVELAAGGWAEPVDGILGMDALAGDRLAFDLRSGTLAFGDADPARGRPAGQAVPVREVDGRLLVEARVGGRARTLVLDSGATHLVLFDDGDAGAPARVATAGGSAGARAGRAELHLGDVHLGAVPTLRLAGPSGRGSSDGLLPASLFASIEIDRPAGRIHLVPRR